jgi:hypothetical protein
MQPAANGAAMQATAGQPAACQPNKAQVGRPHTIIIIIIIIADGNDYPFNSQVAVTTEGLHQSKAGHNNSLADSGVSACLSARMQE